MRKQILPNGGVLLDTIELELAGVPPLGVPWDGMGFPYSSTDTDDGVPDGGKWPIAAICCWYCASC